jgi:hypothetical protein
MRQGEIIAIPQVAAGTTAMKASRRVRAEVMYARAESLRYRGQTPKNLFWIGSTQQRSQQP